MNSIIRRYIEIVRIQRDCAEILEDKVALAQYESFIALLHLMAEEVSDYEREIAKLP